MAPAAVPVSVLGAVCNNNYTQRAGGFCVAVPETGPNMQRQAGNGPQPNGGRSARQPAFLTDRRRGTLASFAE
jgi:hypothetical protein